MLLRGYHYRTGELLDLVIEGEQIASLHAADDSQEADHLADIIAPAYFDLQINGGMGVNFTSAHLQQEELERVVEICAAHGMAAFCPTVITASNETILAAMTSLRRACETNPALNHALPWFHLEGPFISAEDGPRGAHPREQVHDADISLFQRWQEAAGGRIKLVTLAPEVPGAIKLIEHLVKQDVVVSLGHSAAPPSVIRDAIAAGAKLSTHLGNGCARMLPRHENILWEQLAADTLWASIIPDGHHLPWNLVRCILRCKTLERVIVTCDSSPLAGLPPGRYRPWGSEVEITDEGKIILSGQGVLAGSWDFTSACVEKLMEHLGLNYSEVHPLACDQPRRLLGLPVPTLEVGQRADVVLLKRDASGVLRHKTSFIGGKAIPRPRTSEPASVAAR
ncbi:MAG TPA: N-acetylglucosamine-6-phosphate deacetylase [Gemmatales bacterium]|nr:N-acetylglucosamine-6-phosphate deacetylase [Gemmatales bacterium]